MRSRSRDWQNTVVVVVGDHWQLPGVPLIVKPVASRGLGRATYRDCNDASLSSRVSAGRPVRDLTFRKRFTTSSGCGPGTTQQVFAARFGFSINTLRHWEQGKREPEGPTRAYLLVIDRAPQAVQKALRIA
jgi:hypothetical protein